MLTKYSLNVIRSNCIGMRFALLEAKLAIAKALRVVEFQKCEKTEVSNDILRIILLLSIYLSRTVVYRLSNLQSNTLCQKND